MRQKEQQLYMAGMFTASEEWVFLVEWTPLQGTPYFPLDPPGMFPVALQ